jgi:predicted dehydrogenase
MRRAEAGTGALGDIGSHVVDLVRWWLGDVVRVAAQWQTVQRERGGEPVDGDEACSFLARLENGTLAVFQASKLVAGRGNYQRVELFGDRASLVYEAEPGVDATWTGRLWAGRPDRPGLELLPLPAELTAGLDGPDNMAGRLAAYRRLTDPFFAAVRGAGGAGAELAETPGFDDGAAVQAVLDAVARAAERGTWEDVA